MMMSSTVFDRKLNKLKSIIPQPTIIEKQFDNISISEYQGTSILEEDTNRIVDIKVGKK